MAKKRQRGNGAGTVYPRRNKEGKITGYRGSYFAPDGKRRYVSAKRKTECERKLRDAMTDADRGLVYYDKGLTLGKYLDHWLSDCLKPLVHAGKMAHSTFVRYKGIVNNHLKPALSHRKLKDLSRAEVRRLYNEKAKELSPRSVDYIHVTLQKALSQAVRDDLIPRNVASGERPRNGRQQSPEKARALSPTQVRALLAEASGERNEALYIVAVHTGLRQGELLGLKWTDVDLDAGKLSVCRSLKVTDDGLNFGYPKNRSSRRSVPLNKTAVMALKAHRTRQTEERLQATHWRDTDLVFPNRVGGPMDHNNLYYREFKPLLERAGLGENDFTFHSLRHTFASALCNKREHPKVIQSLLGHSSITQTMDTYSHLMQDLGGDAVGGLDEAFA
jgi:integrase